VDASFFPSCGAFNPALTIAANALRVGDHLIKNILKENKKEIVMTEII
jgi:choline dehydrogenase-like flavoprotein